MGKSLSVKKLKTPTVYLVNRRTT